MPQVVDVLVRAANGDQIISPRTHTGAVVSVVDRVLIIDNPSRFPVDVVDAAPTRDF